LVYIDGKLARVIGPGRRVMYWAGHSAVAPEVFDARVDAEVPREAVSALARLSVGASSGCVPAVWANIEQGKTGLLFIDGRLSTGDLFVRSHRVCMHSGLRRESRGSKS
jgi:hypothetical protein